MRKIAFLAVLALVAVPAAFADNAGQTDRASTLCKQQQTAIGAPAFKLLYGSNAYGRCVSRVASTLHADQTNAAKQCAAERDDASFPTTRGGGKTFAQFYGTGKNGNHAFGRCVSSKAKTLEQQHQQDTINAAKTCKTERTALGPAEFTKKYGRSNAFGKCVSKVAHATP
jgi:hypothetical protein